MDEALSIIIARAAELPSSEQHWFIARESARVGIAANQNLSDAAIKNEFIMWSFQCNNSDRSITPAWLPSFVRHILTIGGN